MVSINTNISSVLAQENTRKVNNELEKAMERLSSGLRINSAGDDAAGLAIASRMESQVRGLQAAIKNANDGISVTQVAEGAMEEIGNILQRMRELAVQSANDSNSDSDRAYLQQEVAQLSDEITRISSTTQFNGINVLDGSFSGKSFQIGANGNQSVNLSIANVGAASLGIGAVSSSSSSTNTTTSAVAETIGNLSFSMDDAYSFQFTDDENGLSYRVAPAAATATARSSATDTATIVGHSFRTGDEVALTTNDVLGTAGTVRYVIRIDEDKIQFATSLGNALDGTAIAIPGSGSGFTLPTITGVGLTLQRDDADSRADFAARINIGLKESATNTSVQGNAAAASVDATTFNAGSADDALFKFDVKVGDNTATIDIKNRILATASDTSAVTYTEVVNAMRNELASELDDSLVVTQSSGRFTITDLQGRYLEVSQGEGSGYFFGSDLQNSGALYKEANAQNNVSVAWNDAGTELGVSSAVAGGVNITNFSSTSTGVATFDVADTASTSFTEPVVLQDTAADTAASVRGVIGESKIALNFSNTFGYAADNSSATSALVAEYGFKITDGAGNHYIFFSASDLLDIQSYNQSDATIKAAVETNLAAQIQVGFSGGTSNDTTVTADEFAVDYSNGVLTITNSEGRNLAVEEFSSAYGTATVSLLDGLAGSETLASQGALVSEIRLERGYGTSTISASSATLKVAVGGSSTTNATITDLDLSGVFNTSLATGWAQANAIEALFQAGSTDGLDANLRVAYDEETDEFVIQDTIGREINIVSFTESKPNEAFLRTNAGVANSNLANDVTVDSDTTSGVLTEASSAKLTFNQDSIAAFVLGLNGQTLTSTTFNFGTDTFETHAFKSNLDSLMTTLNAEHNGSPFSYVMDAANKELTINNSQGGELKFDGHTTTSEDLELQLNVMSGVLQSADDTSGNGDAVVKYNEALTAVSAEGDGVVDSTTSSSTSYSSSSSSTVGIDQISISTQAGANSALESIDAALSSILSERAMLGALENRLDHTVNNLSNVSVNTETAKGRILDADFAKETTALTKSQILSQAATSMLAQANQSKQSILALLQ